MKARKRIGDMLVEAGLVTRAQLRQALAAQKGNPIKAGQLLVRQGALAEADLVDVLGKQLGVDRYCPERFPIDVSLASLIPVRTAQECQIVPLEKRGSLLRIGTTDPTDIKRIDAVEALTDKEVEPVICTELELSQIMSSIYGVTGGLGGILEGLGELEYASETEEDLPAVQVGSLVDMAKGAPVVQMINWIIAEAVRQRASDIHISPEANHVQLRYRVDGKLRVMPAPAKPMMPSLVARVKILANMDIAVSRMPQDGRFTIRIDLREVHVRASVAPTIHGESVVLRLLDVSGQAQSLERLGMSEENQARLLELVQLPAGMILSTGPTGSGKTSTLYAILQKINTPDINIVTLEDPVEYRIAGIRQLQLSHRTGMTFAGSLRAAVRHDPDVIMVGEIRDAETASVAIRAGLTGHRVLSTAHTGDAASLITRLIDMGVEPFLVASVLRVSIAQRLVRTACGNCKKPFDPPVALLERWGLKGATEANFVRTVGCTQCMESGYVGRTGVFELLVIDDELRGLILEKSSAPAIAQAAQANGMKTLMEAAAEKIRLGVTTFEEAASAVML